MSWMDDCPEEYYGLYEPVKNERENRKLTVKSKTYVIRGTLHWAKLIGAPRLNTYSGENEWSVDVTPDAKGRAIISDAGLDGKLKTPKKGKDDRKETFLSFRQREYRTGKNGERVKNEPVAISTAQGTSWPEGKLIGNGTIADVKFTHKDNGPGKHPGVYINAVRILKLVPYERDDFEPLSEEDEYFAANEQESPTEYDEADLADSSYDPDDDVPF